MGSVWSWPLARLAWTPHQNSPPRHVPEVKGCASRPAAKPPRPRLPLCLTSRSTDRDGRSLSPLLLLFDASASIPFAEAKSRSSVWKGCAASKPKPRKVPREGCGRCREPAEQCSASPAAFPPPRGRWLSRSTHPPAAPSNASRLQTPTPQATLRHVRRAAMPRKKWFAPTSDGPPRIPRIIRHQT